MARNVVMVVLGFFLVVVVMLKFFTFVNVNWSPPSPKINYGKKYYSDDFEEENKTSPTVATTRTSATTSEPIRDTERPRETNICLQMPTKDDLIIYKEVWQVVEHDDFDIYLHSAHYDEREETPYVRILTIVDRKFLPLDDFSCLLWYESQAEPKVEGKLKKPIRLGLPRADVNKTSSHIISCPVRGGEIPIAVSLTTNKKLEKCDKRATNILQVQHNPLEGSEEKQDFAVCLKGMTFTDPAMIPRLVEWFELLFLLGVRKIYFNYYELHEDILCVLDYYQQRDLMDVKHITWFGEKSSDDLLDILAAKQRSVFFDQENIPRTDCFLRERHKYEYIAFLDTDEIILPREHNKWTDMFEHLENQPGAAKASHFAFHNVYFFQQFLNETEEMEDIPKYMHMLRLIRRARLDTGNRAPKSIVKTESSVIAMFPHHPETCLFEKCKPFWVDSNLAISAHYRSTCQPLIANAKNCQKKYLNDTVIDQSVWKHKTELIERAGKVLRHLGLET